MARKTHDLIRTGLTSELFLLAYVKPDKPRRLAARLYDSEDPDTSKIYPAIHSLTLQNYVKMDDDNRVHANIKMLAEDFEQILQSKNSSFDDEEKTILTNLLQEEIFISAMAPHALEEIRRNSKSKKHNTDTLSVLSDLLGSLTSGYYLSKISGPDANKTISKSEQDTYKEMAMLLDDKNVLKSLNLQMKQMKIANPEFQTINVDSVFKRMLEGMQLYFYLKSMDIPDSFYDKIAKLAESSNIFIMSYMIAGMAKMQHGNKNK